MSRSKSIPKYDDMSPGKIKRGHLGVDPHTSEMPNRFKKDQYQSHVIQIPKHYAKAEKEIAKEGISVSEDEKDIGNITQPIYTTEYKNVKDF